MADQKPATRDVLHALVGAGDLAVEKAVRLAQGDGRRIQEIYEELVTRGRSLSQRVTSSAATKQAAAQTKAARSRVKAAATSVGRAVTANAGAARTIVSRTTKAS